MLRLGQADGADPAGGGTRLEKVDQLLTLTMAAYNLTRLRTLGFVRPAGA